MPAQRWYPAKGRGVALRRLGEIEMTDPAGEADIEVQVIGLDSGDRLDVVQVPLTFRNAPLAGAEHALVGTTGTDRSGTRWVYDAPHDPAYVTALLASLDHPAGRRVPVAKRSSVLRGEQSNTSIIVESDPEVIVKVFRTLHAGQNPDVEVLRALDGFDHVPALVGWQQGHWQAPQGGDALGHLAVAVEFIGDAVDAWRVATDAVRDDVDFTDQARTLGTTTAQLHHALATAFGTVDPDAPFPPVEPGAAPAVAASAGDALVAALRERVEWALRSTDALERHRSALMAYRDRLDLTDMPALQRVHGDFHLGQVLHSQVRGWVVLDFEGEPLRPLAERSNPDLALRDVAGMLRSFDYAAAQAYVTAPGLRDRADAWARATRDAFCAGYASVTGQDPRERSDLLAALELDKALYEVVYESGNRPEWVGVPLAAVERSLAPPR